MKSKVKGLSKKALRQFLHVFWLFPIRKKKIIFICYDGTQYSCNPKYVAEYLITNKIDFDVYFAYKNEVTRKQMIEGIHPVKLNRPSFFYHILTSGTVLTNTNIRDYIPLRKSQILFNTWHGAALKGMPKLKVDYNRTDFFVAENKLTHQVIASPIGMDYHGKILDYGMPRNDILINHPLDLIRATKDKLQINSEVKILMYAPTFREGDSDYLNINLSGVAEELRKRTKCDWIILYRLHHFQKGKIKLENGIDVTDYPDMQHLLLIADVLITDYSSTMWEMSLMNKPVFLYAPDIKRYLETERTAFFYPFEELPFPRAYDNDHLLAIINEFDENKYKVDLAEYHRRMGEFECEGNSTKLLVDVIIKEIKASCIL